MKRFANMVGSVMEQFARQCCDTGTFDADGLKSASTVKN